MTTKKSIARRVYIPSMSILEASLDNSTGEINYLPLAKHGSGVFPDFPVLIQSNGMPWTLGNLYLLKKLEYTNRYEPKTWENISNELLAYLRWLEENDIDPLRFHRIDKEDRPTYKYLHYVTQQIEQNKIAKSTGASRMSAVVNFYRGLNSWRIIENDLIDLAWKDKQVLIKITGKDMQEKLKPVITTDINIKRGNTKESPDTIKDGGKLRPLSKEEQNILIEHLKLSGQTYRLLFITALLTGARVQTLCTLRGSTLRDAIYYEPEKSYIVKVGGTGLEDTKGSKGLTLFVPAKLRDLLVAYWNNDSSKLKRIQSFYGDTPENYLFLNRDGHPFITSKKEMLDRRNPKVNRIVGVQGGVSEELSPRKGQAIWNYINNRLLPKIREKYPDYKSFTFHDLRATYGMNLLETLLAIAEKTKELNESTDTPSPTANALWEVKERMGHSDIETTMRYLDYRRNRDFKASIQASVEEELLSKVSDSALEYDNE